MSRPGPPGFWLRVEETANCWLWRGKRSRSGGRYGQGGYGEFRNRVAHRISYELLVGPIPQGLEIDHLCGVTNCVNPAHLEPVTHLENVRRHYAKQTHCKRGHEFTPENTYLGRPGHRQCRACQRETVRRYRQRKEAS